jgi:pyruvate kinase
MTNRKIVATIWPASESEEKLKEILPYIAIARMNMSHGSHVEHLNKINLIRSLDSETKILIDLQWPKIRLWKFINWKESFRKWDRTHLIFDEDKLNFCDRTHLYVTFEQVVKDLNVWDVILFNDWYMSAKVIEKRPERNRLYVEILNNGVLSSNKWVNSSTASLSIDSLTTKDLIDLEFWLKQNPDYIAISFVRSEKDVINLRSLINKAWWKAKIIVKIERHEAIKNLEEIAKETDKLDEIFE